MKRLDQNKDHIQPKIPQVNDHSKRDLAVVFALALPVFLPLFKQQFFWSHENAYFLWRMASFHQNVLDGMFFCRWFPDFARGLGLPFLEFYPVLPLYIGEIFRFIGIPVIESVKIIIVLVSLFASAGAWQLGRAVWGRSGGLITGVLYSYAPYKMVNLYVRGDINEYMAMAALPWCLFFIYRAAQSEYPRPISLLSIAVLAIPALSHYPSCVIHYPVITMWIIALSLSANKPRRFLLHSFLNLFLSLFLTATFWASAFMSRHLVQMEGMTQGFADYTKHFIYPWQLISFYWNFGASVNGPGDAISFQIGNYALISALLGSLIIGKLILGRTLQCRAIQFSILTSIVFIFFTHSLSHFIWKSVPILPMLQFPYRLLVIPALLTALLGGALGMVIQRIPGKFQFLSTISIGVLITCGSLYMCRAGEYMDLTASELTREDIQLAAHTHCTGEYIPKPVGKRFPPPKPFTFTLEKIPEEGFSRAQTEERLNRWLNNASNIETWEGGLIPIGPVKVQPGQLDVISGAVQISNKTGPLINRSWDINATTQGVLRLNQFYFQGWSAKFNERHQSLEPDPDTGLIQIKIPAGNNRLSIQYSNLPISRNLSWLSIIGIFALIIIRFTVLRNNEKSI